MRKLKIVHIIPFLKNAGAERLLLDLARAHKKEHEITIVCLYPKKDFEINDIKVIYLNKKGGLHLPTFWSLYKVLKKIEPDVVHTHLYVALYAFFWHLLSRKGIGIHTVHTMPAMEFGKIHKFLQKIAYRYLRVTPVGISDIIANQVAKLYSLHPSKVPVIYNCAEIKKYLYPDRTFDYEYFTIIHVASFHPWKNQMMLVEAFFQASKENPSMKLIFVGDGAEEERIKDRVCQYGMADKVTFAGSSDTVPEWLSKANAFVLCSVFEGLPISIIEAKASGLPVVATDVGGVSDIVKNNRNGFLVPSQDVEALKEALLKLSADKKLQQRISRINVEEAHLLDVDHIQKQYMALYETKLGE